MTPKIIFFDIDNTLARMDTIPEHNYNTMQALHEKGIKVVIATGRGMGMMPKQISTLIAQGVISAYSFMNGQYTRTKESIISQYPLSYRECAAIVAVCEKHNLLHKFDSETYCAWSAHSPFYDVIHAHYPNFIIDAEHYKNQSIYQCSFMLNEDTDLAKVQADLSSLDLALTFWSKKGADILPKWSSKLVAVKDVCKYYNCRIEDTMSFGDGLNDAEMITQTGLGIAMGDGSQYIKDIADYVTGSIEEHGIQSALAHFGVLDSD